MDTELNKYEYHVYLAGTCNNSKWREELIKKLQYNVKYVNPICDNWNHEIEMKMREKKKQCKYILYVITKEMKGVLAIANLIDLANKNPEKLLFCYIKDGFDSEQIKSLEEVKFLVEENNAKTFNSLAEISEFLNNL